MDSKVYSRALGYAYFYLKFRLRTVAEVSRYLTKKSPFFVGEISEKLVEQLKINGKMIIPVEDEMFLITKTAESKIKKEFLGYFAFVPLIGKLGHKRY